MTKIKKIDATAIKNLNQELEEIEQEGTTLKKIARTIIDRKKIQSILKKISNN